MQKKFQDVCKRDSRNPLITIEDIPFPCNTVFNAGVTTFDGQTILLLRVEGLDGTSTLVLARSYDGISFQADDKAFMSHSSEEPYHIYEEAGVEDPRITFINEYYYITYTAYSEFGPRIALARTKDFKKVERVALISQPVNKDAALFPRKIQGKYWRADRPVVGSSGHIWLSTSHDLVHWGGNSRVLLKARPRMWDSERIGIGPIPIETEKGWLLIYHGVKNTPGGKIYRLGVALIDIERPYKVIGRGIIPILSPRKPYERIGDVSNIIFSCGAILDKEDGIVRIYYGAADTSLCLATAKLDDLLNICTENNK